MTRGNSFAMRIFFGGHIFPCAESSRSNEGENSRYPIRGKTVQGFATNDFAIAEGIARRLMGLEDADYAADEMDHSVSASIAPLIIVTLLETIALILR